LPISNYGWLWRSYCSSAARFSSSWGKTTSRGQLTVRTSHVRRMTHTGYRLW
jgi:hypothetical protein